MRNKSVRKRLFIQLSLASIILVMLAIAAMVLLTIYGISTLLPVILVMAGIIFLFVLFLGIGILGVVLTIKKKRAYPLFKNAINPTMSLLFPLAVVIGSLFGIDKNKIKLSFIEVHNQLTQVKSLRIAARDILLLLPHCLQYSECKYKITLNVDNCHRCGKCLISQLVELRDELGFHMYVATGGTLARRIIEKIRPKAIIAIACERDLSSGIQDTAATVPVIGIVNQYKEGPCINTTADLEKIKEAIFFFLQEEQAYK